MAYDWGPHYIVPTEVIKKYSGNVQLRESYDAELLRKELEKLGIAGVVERVSNPWYFRKKGTSTWIKVGESQDAHNNFAVRWDTTGLQNGEYEVLGLMHATVKDSGGEKVLARQNTVVVTVEN